MRRDDLIKRIKILKDTREASRVAQETAENKTQSARARLSSSSSYDGKNSDLMDFFSNLITPRKHSSDCTALTSEIEDLQSAKLRIHWRLVGLGVVCGEVEEE